MAKDNDRAEANRVIAELRATAGKLIKRSREMAEDAQQMKRSADDLVQLLKQRDARK